MPAVHGKPRPRLLSRELDDSHRWSGVERPETPRPVEIILATGTVDSRSLFAVNEDHVVAFVPGSPLVVQYGHHHANKLPVSFSIQNDVIIGAQLVEPTRVLVSVGEVIAVEVAFVPPLARSTLPILGMKVCRVGRKRGQLHPVDVPVVIRNLFAALVRDGDSSMSAKWHGEVGVQGLDRIDRNQRRLKNRGNSESQAKKITDRRFDAGIFFAIPVSTNHDFLMNIDLRPTRYCRPDVPNFSRAITIKYRDCLPRIDRYVVMVSAGTVITRSALRLVVFQSGQVSQRKLRPEDRRKEKKNGSVEIAPFHTDCACFATGSDLVPDQPSAGALSSISSP